MATAADKNRLNRAIEEHEKVLARWRSYAPDEYLERAIGELAEKIGRLRQERAAMDRAEGTPPPAEHAMLKRIK